MAGILTTRIASTADGEPGRQASGVTEQRSMSFSEIDLDKWERREAFGFFSGISDPFYMVSFRMDVTDLYDYTKASGLSFYHGMIWACTGAVNDTEAFRVMIRDGRLVRTDRRDPSFTVLKEGEEQFRIVTMDHIGDIDGFCREAARRSEEQKSFIDMSKESDSLIYLSCLPWIEMTAITNERDRNAPGAADDSIPRIAWGKYTEEGGRKKLTISVEANHRFIDGVHIGRFAENLEDRMKSLHRQ